MCFARNTIGCCDYNIRSVDQFGRTQWRRKWDAAERWIPGPPYGGWFHPAPVLCCAALPDGRTIVGGVHRKKDAHIAGMYSPSGELLWSSGFEDLTPPSYSGSDPDPFYDPHWWVYAAVYAGENNIVLAACRENADPPLIYNIVDHRLINIDEDGNVLAYTDITNKGLHYLSAHNGDVLVGYDNDNGSGGAAIWSADRATYQTVNLTNFGSSWSPYFPATHDAVFDLSGENIIAAHRGVLFIPSYTEKYPLVGGDAVWRFQTGNNTNYQTPNTVAIQSSGKVILAGPVLLTPTTGTTLARLTADGDFETDLAAIGDVAGAQARARIASVPTDALVIWWRSSSALGFSLRDDEGHKTWRHAGFSPWECTAHSDGRIVVVGNTTKPSQEQNFV